MKKRFVFCYTVVVCLMSVAGCATRMYEFPVSEVYLPRDGKIVFVQEGQSGPVVSEVVYDPNFSRDNAIQVIPDVAPDGTNWVALSLLDAKFLGDYGLKRLVIHVRTTNDVRRNLVPIAPR